jgi:hypothetical protein
MLTAQQIPNELKMVWDLDDGIARDPAEFAALTVLPQGFLPKQCSYYFFGERKAPLLEWRALMTSLQPLLDQRIKLRFICTSQKIADWLKEIGVSLLGEITCDPSLNAPKEINKKRN